MSRPETQMPWACVVGDPIAHSLSPLLHQTWLQETGTLGNYSAVKLSTAQFNSTMLQYFADSHFLGANITLPHKQAALDLADIVSPLAQQVGAANFLYRAEGKIYADNTDVHGFLAPLLRVLDQRGLSKKRACVFGAGGAARAVLIGLQQVGIERVLLCNRTDEKAALLSEELEFSNLECLAWSERNDPSFSPDLVVNAGSAGMTGFGKLDINLAFCHQETLVYDLVYKPLLTPLLAQAKQKNLRVLGGLEMLVSQAKPCFERLFGAKPPQDSKAMNRALAQLEQDGAK
ncbi:MAG: shikimate dehydrogenase [Robiginitomaculum sp.]|nr:MAG: shikimate dehydrogenase [Robiginitomaculum sp.]